MSQEDRRTAPTQNGFVGEGIVDGAKMDHRSTTPTDLSVEKQIYAGREDDGHQMGDFFDTFKQNGCL